MNKRKLFLVTSALTVMILMGCGDKNDERISDPLSSDNMSSSFSEQNEDILNYSIINKETQKKGGSLNPLQSPKYILFIVKVALTGNNKLNKSNVEATLRDILSKLQRSNDADAIAVLLYESKESSSFFARIEWWPKNHSLSRKNHTNIINKATYKTDIEILSLAQKIKVDAESGIKIPIQKRKKIFREKFQSELKAIRAADKKYDVTVQWKQHIEEVNRLTDVYSEQICQKYNVSEDELQDIVIDGAINHW